MDSGLAAIAEIRNDKPVGRVSRQRVWAELVRRCAAYPAVLHRGADYAPLIRPTRCECVAGLLPEPKSAWIAGLSDVKTALRACCPAMTRRRPRLDIIRDGKRGPGGRWGQKRTACVP